MGIMINRQKQKVHFGKINISNPHFAIYFSDNETSHWELIGLLSVAQMVEDIRLALYTKKVQNPNVYKLLQNELHFYLYELKNPNPISYLIYHCSTLSNVYSKIHFSFIPEITKDNLIYYIKTNSKFIGIYDDKNVSILQEKYFNIIFDNIYKKAIGKYNIDKNNYNYQLQVLNEYLFNELPRVGQFQLEEGMTNEELSQFISKLQILDFCNILNYLLKIKIMKRKEIENMLIFFYVNSYLKGTDNF